MSTMTLEEEGAFRRLLDHHWREGSIPADPEELRRLCKWVSPRRFAAIWKRISGRFTPSPIENRLVNLRSAAQKTDLEEFRRARRESGAKGAKGRWGDDGGAIHLPMATDSSSSAICDLRSAEKKKETLLLPAKPIGAADLDAVYQRYPRHDGKTPGMRIAKREITSPELLAELGRAVDAYVVKVREETVERKFVLHWSTFMGRWRDFLVPAEPAAMDLRGPKERELDEALLERERAAGRL